MDFASPSAPGTGGEAFTTFLLGIPDAGTITNLHNVDYHRENYAWFAQDDFRLTPKLTLNLGLRYEIFTTVKARFNEEANFSFASDSLIVPRGQQAQLTPTLAALIPIERTGTPGLIPPDLTNFAPRVGLAYQITDKLVLRAGYGIFYGVEENGPFSNPSPGFNPPFFVTQQFAQPCVLSAANPSGPDCSIPGLNVLAQGFPANALVDPNTPTLFSENPRLPTPYVQQWHVGFRYQLPAQTLLDISYAGSHGTNLFGMYNGNQAQPNVAFCTTNGNTPENCPTAPRRPFPTIDGGIDTLRPFGNGKKFGGDATGLKNQVIGNWQVAGITTAQTGNWFTITDSVTNFSTSDGGGVVGLYEVRPNVVGNPNGKPCVPGTLFNTCAFVDNMTFFTFGNAGRNIVLGPGLQNWDFSIFKLFPIREQMHFEFRAEFFNIWNHVNPLLGPIGAISEEPQAVEFGTPQFGFPNAARDPRFVQFALKFYF